MYYLLFISSPCQNRRMAECSSPESQELCLELTVLESRYRKMFGNENSFSCQSNFAFCYDKIHPKPHRGLPQASHGKINSPIEHYADLNQLKSVRSPTYSNNHEICMKYSKIFNSVHNVEMPSEKCLTFCLFPLLARIAEWRNVPRQNHRNYA